MLEKIQNAYNQLPEVEKEVIINDVPVKIKFIRQLSTIDKFSMVNTVFDALIEEENGKNTVDKSLAKILLKIFIITKCTNLQIPDTKQDYATLNKFIEFYDCFTPNSIENILTLINDNLSTPNLYEELMEMFEDKLDEFKEIRKIEYSLGVSIINWLNSQTKEQFGSLDTIANGLKELNQIFGNIENVVDVNEKIQKIANEENNKKTKQTKEKVTKNG